MRISGEQRPEYYRFASAVLAAKLPRVHDSRILTRLDDDGQPVGCIVYRHITETNLEMMIALAHDGYGLNLEFMYRMFCYPFVQLRLPHVSTCADEANEASVRLTLHAGFQIEGRMRRIHNGRDGIIFGMCRDECRWIGPRLKDRYHG
jgi:RimJ/RimL family protein N-acetyltransferase